MYQYTFMYQIRLSLFEQGASRNRTGTNGTEAFRDSPWILLYELDPQLNSFIQPEGEEAAENLPSDLADRSAGVPYAELPKFCDKIENIW